jgi:hypothetical protein
MRADYYLHFERRHGRLLHSASVSQDSGRNSEEVQPFEDKASSIYPQEDARIDNSFSQWRADCTFGIRWKPLLQSPPPSQRSTIHLIPDFARC